MDRSPRQCATRRAFWGPTAWAFVTLLAAGCAQSRNSIQRENEEAGVPDWAISASAAATTEIQAYGSALSVAPGESLHIFVSTSTEGTPYSAEVLRLGWYHGTGARLMDTRVGMGTAQGHYDRASKTLVDCHSCTLDPSTHLVEAHWQPSFSITAGATWVSGRYVVKLTTTDGKQTYVPFVVRGDSPSTLVAVLPDMTSAAYNNWGGYSTYEGPDGALASRAYKVSFDRPNNKWHVGYGHGLPYEINAIRWLERNGYEVTYLSSLDVHAHPDLLLEHRAFLSLGHDEYWSNEMRVAVEHARDAGLGLGFLGANSAYWQVRLEPNSDGRRDRTLVCYKDALLDPMLGRQPSRVTTRWRDAPVDKPENALIGVAYVDWVRPPAGYPWRVDADAPSWLLSGTGLQRGRSYGCNVVGYEWDSLLANGKTPANLQLLGSTPTIGESGTPETANTSYYVAPSGSLVFASGSVNWAYALDDARALDENPDEMGPVRADPFCTQHSPSVPEVSKLMENVMAELLVTHAKIQ